jgi:cytosine deaminase
MIDPRAGDPLEARTRLSPVALPISAGAYEIVLADGRIAAIHPARGTPEWLLLPAFANMHTHAERAFSAGPAPKSFADALRQSEEMRKSASEADFHDRAAMLFSRALAHGTLRLRSHTDIDDLVEDRALRGVVAARKAFAGRLDVEIVAFANARTDPAGRDGQKRLVAALGQGADLIGAVPAFAPDPRRAVEAVLDLARAEDVPVDFHLDEHGEPAESLLSFVIDEVVRRGLEGRVALSHVCALATLPPAEAQSLARRLAAARITVIALPATNLYLQDRGAGTPRRRGVTLVKELLAAGVAVWLGSDNVRDSFYPYGDADPLEDAWLAALAAHLDEPAQLLAALSAGRGEPKAGDPADLVLVKAASLTDALARRPDARILLRAGQRVVVS